jgi:hypothetical protein
VNRILLACALLTLAGGALAADFGGDWKITAVIGGNPSDIRCTLVQKRNRLTGSCKPAQFAPSAATGSVTGTQAKWGYDVVFNGNQNHVEYEASFVGNGKIAGTLHLGLTPAPFTAVRE